eukprot:206774-Amphidinium_carterae.1
MQQCKPEANGSEGMHKRTDREEDANATTMPKSTTSNSPEMNIARKSAMSMTRKSPKSTTKPKP